MKASCTDNEWVCEFVKFVKMSEPSLLAAQDTMVATSNNDFKEEWQEQ